jgi:hypothetical protein
MEMAHLARRAERLAQLQDEGLYSGFWQQLAAVLDHCVFEVALNNGTKEANRDWTDAA